MKTPISLLLTAFLGLVATAVLPAQDGHDHGPLRTSAYDAELVHTFRTLPVQDRGRVKPFMTVASYMLLRLNQKRSVVVPDEPRFGEVAGAKLSATEWAMDVLLYPEQAADYPCIVVTDAEALQIVGLGSVAKRKRDRYSWNELAPGIDRLRLFFDEYRRIEEVDRSRLQNQIVYLWNDLSEYSGLAHAFDAARELLEVGDSKTLQSAFGQAGSVRFSVGAEQAGRLTLAMATLDDAPDVGSDEDKRRERSVISGFLEQQARVAGWSAALAWLPPSDRENEEWLGFSGVYDQIRADGPASHRSQLDAIAKLEVVVDSAGDPALLGVSVREWVQHVQGLADARGEAGKVAQEVAYLEANYFYQALIYFIVGFLLAAFMWLWPRARVLPWLAWIVTLVGAGYVTVGVIVRCILRDRPPVTTLYETILFITGCVVLVALAIEAVNRRRIAISLGALLGAVGMFFANRYEIVDGKDTMPELVAVLDTNFWLATHVTTVTFGYAAGLFAGFIAHVYLFGKLIGFKKGNYSFYSTVGRMVYGVLCFGVVLSTIGTILGGIWANESWGRFWGWDPKENGALLIVLWELLILHGRLGGFWRDWGVCMLAVIGNIVVVFSWWGVNLMGVGLHSYGFTAGLKNAVTTFYLVEVVVLAVGVAAWFIEKQRNAAPPEPVST